MTNAVEAWRRAVAAELSPQRLAHVEGVVRQALHWWRAWGAAGASETQVLAAAWLHDIAKERPKAELRTLLDEWVPALDPEEAASPSLWHAPVGAEWARRRLGVGDAAVWSAIRWHPIGRVDMSDLDAILMAADFTEPGREFAAAEPVRAACARGMGPGLIAVLEAKITFGLKAGRAVHPNTLAARNAWLRRL
ncbi:MAG TPA: bis(5'-nucleosyl)-tetraphosphatase (symmetrical) YqeK [Limnochordia bacterium]|nr:bis(5'-nucleosyl)-tetraphosphatase (symmetrical) YqeK [Limnochordia bacterium]